MDFLDWLTDVIDLVYEKDDEKSYGSVSEDDLEEIATDLINGKKEHDKKCCDEKNCHCDKKDSEDKDSPASSPAPYDDNKKDNDKVTSTKENVIGKAAAKSAALKHAGITEAQATQLKVELDRDDGKLVYDVEFKSAGYEYDYEIDAVKGTILQSDKELDD